MADSGMKISLPSFNAKTATEDKLNVDTKYPSFKIAKRGTITFNTAPYIDPNAQDFSRVTLTIPHNLGYAPAFWAYGINNDSDNQCIFVPFPAHGEIGVDAYADSTNLYFQLYMAGWAMTTRTWWGYYYIFYDQG